MKAAAVTVDYVALEKQMRKLERAAPEKAEAILKMVAYYLKDERTQSTVARERTQRRQINRRLMRAHACPSVYVGFTQQAPSASGRVWKCVGCGQIVTLDGEKGGL